MEVPEFFVGGYMGATDFSAGTADQKPGDHFAIDDLLDFSNNDDDDGAAAVIASESFFDNVAGNSVDSSTLTAVDSCNSSFSAAEQQFSGDLCVPCDDLAELEWLSNFVENSFSAERDFHSLQFLSAATTSSSPPKPLTPETPSSSETPQNATFFPRETPLPGKARSKRSRAAPGDWTTRLLHLANHNADVAKQGRTGPAKKKESPVPGPGLGSESSGGRKCLHCAAEKTPQWRTGPMGPKTLCNACGVRYKSGRLVPEYRPAASPTFVSAKHSNSHRKVLELRRQKELHIAHHHHHFIRQTSIFGVSNGGDDFLIHHRARFSAFDLVVDASVGDPNSFKDN